MTVITNIEQKILQLESGKFQRLCDSYLCKKGYSNIVALGSQAGANKTTLGTPDTYFYSQKDKYVLVEYSTRKSGLFEKINDDIKKCLDELKTGITHDKILKIIYCHTSSNITPSQDNELRALCENVGIELSIIGINELARRLQEYPHIVREYLDIAISSEQIQSFDDFVNSYNKNKMAAPIDTEFLFREKNIIEIDEAYKKVEIVILSGEAGVGKTRLALHYAKKHSENCSEKLYCIHDNGLPIYDDLVSCMDTPGNYFLFIDDANELSKLNQIIGYVNNKSEQYSIKILITVRKYAIEKVTNDVQVIASCDVININKFTDDEITKILGTALKTLNHNYHERIVQIAEGNARIAVLAGKLACEKNDLTSIRDASQLYGVYYSFYLKENQLLNDDNMCRTAGIVAFLKAIHLDHIDFILPILEEKGLNQNNFDNNIKKLHEQEIIDICNDKVVNFSDQCLSNYLLKYVFYDKKLISLSSMIRACFPDNKERTIFSINTLLSIFQNKELNQFVEEEIKVLWKELSKEKSNCFPEFVKAFFPINPTQTLVILKDKIEREKTVTIEGSTIDFEKNKNNQSITNETIEILGGFVHMPDFPAALELFFEYYLKRPDLYMEFYHAVNTYFGIKRTSINDKFYTQITLFEKIKELSDDWTKELIVNFFLEIAENFLKLNFSPIEGKRNNLVAIYQIELAASEGVKKYRRLIWEYLSILCKNDKYKEKIRKILNSYKGCINKESISVLEFDLAHIKPLLEFNFSEDKLENCILVDRLMKVFKGADIPCEVDFYEYFDSESFKQYNILRGPEFKREMDYKELKHSKEQSIKEYVSKCDIPMFKCLIDVYNDVCNNMDGLLNKNEVYEVEDGLRIAFDCIARNKNLYVNAVKYYMKKDISKVLCLNHVISVLFSLTSDSEVYHLISESTCGSKNEWLYAYYHELPAEFITEKHLKGLYDFLADTSDGDITLSLYRDVSFLEKYNIMDKDVFLKGCKIILNKSEYSKFIVDIYFCRLFNTSHGKMKCVIEKFNSDLDLLVEIYYVMLSCGGDFDSSGEFLRDIYLVKPEILNKYIEYLIDVINSPYKDCLNRNLCFFALDYFVEIYNKIFNQLIEGLQCPTISMPKFLKLLLLSVKNDLNLLEKQDTWIRNCIDIFSADSTKMCCLFSVISELEITRKKGYVRLFIDKNPSIEDFKKIPLTPSSLFWTNSVIPIYSDQIKDLESLLPIFTGLKYIEHKNCIEEKINRLKKYIKDEENSEIMRGHS